MPEGPSLVILKEEVAKFTGSNVQTVSGNTKAFDVSIVKNKKVIEFKTWGKHFLICFKKFTIKVHFMLFGSYRINEKKDSPARFSMTFKNGEINFYACSVKLIVEDLNSIYDWQADVMSDAWNPKLAKEKLLSQPGIFACDALLDQHVFSGVGNIIKNEVLFRIKVHPLSTIGALPVSKLNELIKEARNYSFEFLSWKKQNVLKRQWLAHRKKKCPRDMEPYEIKNTGKSHRKSYWCNSCQIKYIHVC